MSLLLFLADFLRASGTLGEPITPALVEKGAEFFAEIFGESP